MKELVSKKYKEYMDKQPKRNITTLKSIVSDLYDNHKLKVKEIVPVCLEELKNLKKADLYVTNFNGHTTGIKLSAINGGYTFYMKGGGLALQSIPVFHIPYQTQLHPNL